MASPRFYTAGAALNPTALYWAPWGAKPVAVSKGDMPMPSRAVDATSANPQVVSHLLLADGDIPNNPRLPLLLYPSAVGLADYDPAAVFEELFAANGWVGCWRNGIFPFHHYHSTAHEVLGIYSGTAQVQLGGEKGVTLTLSPGDVAIIPAGVGHKKLSASGALGVVGAYPRGQQPDICRGASVSCQFAAQQVARVCVPERDPVYGLGGPLCSYWA